MIINTNVSSITAQEAATNTGKSIKSSLEKLSTGLKINKASDDASGLAIADKLRTQATSIDQGVANGNSAVTLLQIADKSMAEQSNILDTIKAKLIQANTDTTSTDGRESIRKDISKLLEQLDNIAEQTNYNGNVLLQASAGDTDADKAASASLSFQIGESKNDIISNASVQSNTSGLGSKDVYSEANGNNVFSATSTTTVASAGAITLNSTNTDGLSTQESVSLSGDVDSLTLKEGMTISNADAATTAILDAAVTAGNLTLTSGTYTVQSAGEGKTIDLSSVDAVTADITTPAETITVAAQDLTTTVGDIVDTTNNTPTIGGALETALADTTKFEDIGDGKYKALTAETIALETGESISLLDATTVDIGQGSTVPAGSSITLNEDVLSGSDLANQLANTAKFDLASGTDGEAGAVYTVKADFTTDNLKVVAGESITVTNAEAVSLPAATVSAAAMIGDGTVTLGGTAVDWDEANGTLIAEGGTNGDDALVVSSPTELKFDVVATVAAQTFDAKAGDTVIVTDTTTLGTGLSEAIIENANWIDNGDGSYTAIADQAGIAFDDVGDKLEVTRIVGSTATPATTVGTEATTISRDAEATASAAVSLSFTTDTTVDVTNNGAAADSLTVTGDGTNTVSNGGTNLSAIADLSSGELTTELADSFQAVVDDAITKLNGFRGDIGSTQNQVESAVRNLMTQSTNVQAAESIIRDVDYAQESANFNKQNIISQAGSYAISQANSVQQNVLKLLQ
ncbi:flagellin N-terminal helical domain-containing protein [Poseidonibacter ostreae]|jgi:flagellin|uniref:flagellin N-terminal helical domain-containing protein n=1 Tax=Poseidonibacter ostreae TaxID=2654171 RepID=UPI001D00277B|nr:flagellin [Poseidonibacter ostreae]